MFSIYREKEEDPWRQVIKTIYWLASYKKQPEKINNKKFCCSFAAELVWKCIFKIGGKYSICLEKFRVLLGYWCTKCGCTIHNINTRWLQKENNKVGMWDNHVRHQQSSIDLFQINLPGKRWKATITVPCTAL